MLVQKGYNKLELQDLQSLKENKLTNYIDIEILKKKLQRLKIICSKNKWSTIDVTKKSVEEIAATALEYF